MIVPAHNSARDARGRAGLVCRRGRAPIAVVPNLALPEQGERASPLDRADAAGTPLTAGRPGSDSRVRRGGKGWPLVRRACGGRHCRFRCPASQSLNVSVAAAVLLYGREGARRCPSHALPLRAGALSLLHAAAGRVRGSSTGRKGLSRRPAPRRIVFDRAGRTLERGPLSVRPTRRTRTRCAGRLAADHRSREQVCLVSSDIAVRARQIQVRKLSSKRSCATSGSTEPRAELPLRLPERLTGDASQTGEARRARNLAAEKCKNLASAEECYQQLLRMGTLSQSPPLLRIPGTQCARAATAVRTRSQRELEVATGHARPQRRRPRPGR